MHVDESRDLQQLKRAKIRYLYLSLPGCLPLLLWASSRSSSSLPLEGLLQLQQVVEVKEGEVQEGELKVEEGTTLWEAGRSCRNTLSRC